MSTKSKTGGNYEYSEIRRFFLAGEIYSCQPLIEDNLITNLLIPVNAIASKDIPVIIEWAKKGVCILIDSGIHNLTQQAQKKLGITSSESLLMSPTEIEGYDALYAKYIDYVKILSPYIWGYIEMDQGGAKNKIQIRKQIQKTGLNPIPVYHPMIDPYEYFDELASEYDRVCLGNLAFQTITERTKFLYTIDQRKKMYPELWVHALGMKPNPLLFASGINSGDSSSWLSGVRWGFVTADAGAESLGHLDRRFTYSKKEASDSHLQCRKILAYNANIVNINWNSYAQEQVT